MKVSSETGANMVMVSIIGQMAPSIRAIGRIINLMELAIIRGPTAENIMVNGSKI